MAYTYRLQDLLALLQTKAPATADALAANHRRVDHGLLSVGLKIHCLDDGQQFDKLIEGLGGALEGSGGQPLQRCSRIACALCCRRLGAPPPPFTSSNASSNSSARQFLAIGKSSFSYVLRDGSVRGHPPCLESAFISARILCVATPRPTSEQRLRRIFKHPRGIRLVLYDAEGDFDRDFAWWNQPGRPRAQSSRSKMVELIF